MFKEYSMLKEYVKRVKIHNFFLTQLSSEEVF